MLRLGSFLLNDDRSITKNHTKKCPQVKLEIFSEKENVDQLDWAMESLKVYIRVVVLQSCVLVFPSCTCVQPLPKASNLVAMAGAEEKPQYHPYETLV